MAQNEAAGGKVRKDRDQHVADHFNCQDHYIFYVRKQEKGLQKYDHLYIYCFGISDIHCPLRNDRDYPVAVHCDGSNLVCIGLDKVCMQQRGGKS